MNHGQHAHKPTAIIASSGCRIILILVVLVLFTVIHFDGNQLQAAAGDYSFDQQVQPRFFDRIILTWKENPATSQAVTWRTKAAVKAAVAEIAVANSSPDFQKNSRTFEATTTEPQNGQKMYTITP